MREIFTIKGNGNFKNWLWEVKIFTTTCSFPYLLLTQIFFGLFFLYLIVIFLNLARQFGDRRTYFTFLEMTHQWNFGLHLYYLFRDNSSVESKIEIIQLIGDACQSPQIEHWLSDTNGNPGKISAFGMKRNI